MFGLLKSYRVIDALGQVKQVKTLASNLMFWALVLSALVQENHTRFQIEFKINVSVVAVRRAFVTTHNYTRKNIS